MDLMPCRMDSGEVESGKSISQIVSSKLPNRDTEPEGTWYFQWNKLDFLTLKKAARISFLTFLKVNSKAL